jgi:hypothetical protein
MFSGWFDTKDLDTFADSVVADLRNRFPAAGLDLSDDKAVAKATRTLNTIFNQLGGLARSGKLNLYKKAHLGNRVRWALKDAGYPPGFVDAVTHELVTYVTLASRRQAG